MPIWVPVATAAIAAAVVVWLDILIGRRKRAKSKREAVAKFRSVLAEAIAHLDNIDTHAFITEASEQHDAAIVGVRRFVDAKQIESFDAAVQKFSRCRTEVQPAPAKVLTSLESGKPVDNSDTIKLKEALNELLKFADSTQEM